MIDLTATRRGPDIVLAWTDSESFGVYTIMKSPGQGPYCMLAMTHDGVMTYTDRGVPSSTLVSYYVTAARSNTVNVDPTPPTPPSPPSSLVIAQGVGSINVATNLALRDPYIAEVAIQQGQPSLMVHDLKNHTTGAYVIPQLTDANASAAWVSDTELWLWASGTAYQVIHLPDQPVFIDETKVFGDTDSRDAPMIALANGGLVGAWTQHTSALGTNDLVMGFAYRAPSGVWTTLPVVLPAAGGGNITAATVALCQHPVDGNIWCFVKRDGYHWMSAVVLRVDDLSIDLEDVVPQYITQATDGDNGPEAEFPDLKAVADPDGGVIRLVYQDRVFKTFVTEPEVIKGAYVSVAAIDVLGQVAFGPPLQQWVPRSIRMSLSLVDGDVLLGYRLLHDPDGADLGINWSRLHGGAWSAPAPLSMGPKPQAALAYEPTFWIVDTDGILRQVTIT